MIRACLVNTVIISAADTGFFGLLSGLVKSIRATQPEPLPFSVLDCGLEPDQRGWLQAMNQLVGLVEPPRRLGPIPPAVEPDAADLAVVRQQLPELTVHEIDVGVPVACIRPAGRAAGFWQTRRTIFRPFILI